MAADFASEFIRVSREAIANKHWPAVRASLEGLGFGTSKRRVNAATTEVLEATMRDIERQAAETLAACSDDTTPAPEDHEADACSIPYIVFRIDCTLAKLLDSMCTMDEQRLATRRWAGGRSSTPLEAIMEFSAALADLAGQLSAMAGDRASSRSQDSLPS